LSGSIQCIFTSGLLSIARQNSFTVIGRSSCGGRFVGKDLEFTARD